MNRTDLYGFRQGVDFARQMILDAPRNLSPKPIIENLMRSLGNKPPAQQEGIKSVIYLLENADDIQAVRDKG